MASDSATALLWWVCWCCPREAVCACVWLYVCVCMWVAEGGLFVSGGIYRAGDWPIRGIKGVGAWCGALFMQKLGTSVSFIDAFNPGGRLGFSLRALLIALVFAKVRACVDCR